MDEKMTFPVGYEKFHKKQFYNYQINRWYSFGYLQYEDCKKAGSRIKKFKDWVPVMTGLAEEKLAGKDYVSAAFFYRAAEFYTTYGRKEKEHLYDQFTQLFYSRIIPEEAITETVPYEDSCLAVLKLLHKNNTGKGPLLLHGGFDSFMEEWYRMALYLYWRGYDIILFEGPGQGKTVNKYRIPFDYRWEKPVKAILDYYRLEEAALFGISLGGYLCLRAAAFEPRIKRVISTGGAYDYYRIPPQIAQNIMTFFRKHLRESTKKSFLKQIEKEGVQGWSISNLMHITKMEVPLEACEYAWEMSEENLHADNIRQDVLVITNRDDHFIPFKLHEPLIRSLTNAKSVTDMVFTKENNAADHCSVGNIPLLLDTVLDWLDGN